jgi:DNA-binding CsgD family transcriptional regulator
MSRSLSAIEQRMLHTAALLTDLHTAEEIDRAAADLVHSLIESDDLLFAQLDLTRPAVVSHVRRGDGGRPRRVGVEAPTRLWRSSATFDESAQRRGAYQLTLLTQLERGGGKGWVLTRSDRDFSEEDVETARLILPLLTALVELADAKKEPGRVLCKSLTPRERGVLELLATGRSARTIARDLGLTEATARKHLSHIYGKLGVHDRLSAVLVLNRRAG